MKKKLFSWMLILVLLVGMALSASAATDSFVYDEAGLLSAGERSDLSRKLERISDAYDAQIVVVTIDASDDVDFYLDYVYDTMGFGYGEGHDGVLLLVCMNPREYRILSNGYCGTAIDNGDISDIGDAIVSDLSDGYYADAFDAFADECEYYLNGHINGFPFDFGLSLVIALVIGLIVGFITVTVLKGQLKTVRSQSMAREYITPGSLDLRARSDVYLYRDVHRTRRQSSSSSGSSSGGSRSRGGGSF